MDYVCLAIFNQDNTREWQLMGQLMYAFFHTVLHDNGVL